MSVGTPMITTGRGGAGNIRSPKLRPVDTVKEVLDTPTLKNSMYTTGRGGSGNMAKNDKGTEARKAQDVDPVIRADRRAGAPVSTGRGGGGNMYHEKPLDKKSVSPPGARGRDKPRQGSAVSDIARDVLRKIRSNSSRRRSVEGGSARSSMSSDRQKNSI